MLPRMILAAIATGLSAVWLWMLLRVQKIDWRMAAYCRVLQNQQKIDDLRKKEDENCRKVEESYGGMKVLMRLLLTTDYGKAIAKLEKENNDLAHGRLKSVNILQLPGFAAVRMFQQLTQNNIYKKILMNCFELYGKKYAPYKAKEAIAEMCSYALFGLAVVFAVGALALSSGNKNGVMAVMLVGPMILLVLVYAIFDTTKDLAEKRRSAIERQLPNVVSKLALLVSSGMIMDKAWRQTAQSSNAELYLEMQKVSEEMDNAVAPEVAYSTFIDRCNTKQTTKLASAIMQNMSKGNAEIGKLLREMAKEMWSERRNFAKRDSEKANSKLMIPTMLIFVSILVMIMVPIATSFSSW